MVGIKEVTVVEVKIKEPEGKPTWLNNKKGIQIKEVLVGKEAHTIVGEEEAIAKVQDPTL